MPTTQLQFNLTNLARVLIHTRLTASDASCSGSCSAIASNRVTVNANPVIDGLKASFTTICSGSTSTLNVCSSAITAGPQTEPTGYAASSANNTTDEDILNNLGTLNNTSTCATVAGGPGSIQNRYSNYTTTVAAPTVTAGTTVPISIQVGTCGSNFDNWTNVYIDWNRNGTLMPTNRHIRLRQQRTVPHVESGNIGIPLTAPAV